LNTANASAENSWIVGVGGSLDNGDYRGVNVLYDYVFGDAKSVTIAIHHSIYKAQPEKI